MSRECCGALTNHKGEKGPTGVVRVRSRVEKVVLGSLEMLMLETIHGVSCMSSVMWGTEAE